MFTIVVRNNSNPKAIDASLMLAAYFSSQGIEFAIVGSEELVGPSSHERYASLIERKPELAVALGGDGTILRTARLLQATETPILGINFGHLGFLANENEGAVVEMVSRALAGELLSERRTNLRVDVVFDGGPDPFEVGGEFAHSYFALNEVAITRGAVSRIIDFAFGISGCHMARMRGDGLVVSSATGSTGYALSAGGPLVAPGFSGLIVVPIAPHTLLSRAVLTSENDIVVIELGQEDGAGREATLAFDGEALETESRVRRVYVRRGEKPTNLLRNDDQCFYRHASEVFFQ